MADLSNDPERRNEALQVEAKTHEAAIREVVEAWRPDVLALRGIGPIVAAEVLCAWSHPGRCRNDARSRRSPASRHLRRRRA